MLKRLYRESNLKAKSQKLIRSTILEFYHLFYISYFLLTLPTQDYSLPFFPKKTLIR